MICPVRRSRPTSLEMNPMGDCNGFTGSTTQQAPTVRSGRLTSTANGNQEATATRFTVGLRGERADDPGFWAQVQIGDPDDCWEWQGSRDTDGYGRDRRGGVTRRSSRVAFFLATGIDPGDLLVCHSCDNPPCCNPAHLWLGTHQDNSRDMVEKGRSTSGRSGWVSPFKGLKFPERRKSHCKNGHEYTEENTYWDKRGKRSCKKCRRVALQQHRERRKS